MLKTSRCSQRRQAKRRPETYILGSDRAQDTEARVAVWRIAKTFEKTRLRDFSTVAGYQAILTLWVFGIVPSKTARQSGEKTLVQGLSSLHTSKNAQGQDCRVLLDGTEDKSVKSFKLLGREIVGLTDVAATYANGPGNFCSLRKSKEVMLISSKVLRLAFPESRNGLPLWSRTWSTC